MDDVRAQQILGRGHEDFDDALRGDPHDIVGSLQAALIGGIAAVFFLAIFFGGEIALWLEGRL